MNIEVICIDLFNIKYKKLEDSRMKTLDDVLIKTISLYLPHSIDDIKSAYEVLKSFDMVLKASNLALSQAIDLGNAANEINKIMQVNTQKYQIAFDVWHEYLDYFDAEAADEEGGFNGWLRAKKGVIMGGFTELNNGGTTASNKDKYKIVREVYSEYMKEFAEGKTNCTLFIDWFNNKENILNQYPHNGIEDGAMPEQKEFTSDELGVSAEELTKMSRKIEIKAAQEIAKGIEEYAKWIESVKELYKCLPEER